MAKLRWLMAFCIPISLFRKQCVFCVNNQKLTKREQEVHLKTHFSKLFKCSVCKFGFEKWVEAVRHVNNRHEAVADRRVLLPQSAEQLLAASCRLRRCRRQFLALSSKDRAHFFVGKIHS